MLLGLLPGPLPGLTLPFGATSAHAQKAFLEIGVTSGSHEEIFEGQAARVPRILRAPGAVMHAMPFTRVT
ncbi:hypothetical protein OVY01_05775 [Robbsia sp. Bb-Pol-6]|uniref:Uncharacterized protein n=1 Tax=Robbsia betulipollinis TaxID=2981849 RepID=A0ABT3ZJN8_9BURK|nr:hypothetical protein [Robbsia betulipollinis]MCY0386753.1 hypothetical protein [Robbsia betulipollinis]